MKVYLRLFSAILMFTLSGLLVAAQEIKPAQTTVAQVTNTGKTENDDKKTESVAVQDPLLVLLIKKGLINESEGRTIAGSGSAEQQRDRLANLLLSKGLISNSEFESIRTIAPANTLSVSTVSNRTTPETPKSAVSSTTSAAQTTPVPVIPAIAPLRVLQLEGSKRDGLIPDIKLGSGAKLKLYGFFKTSAVWDSSQPSGTDFPLPGFLADSGPDGAPQFHIKARALRLGANFEWLDISPNLTLTGRFEFDFEGDFPRAVNRNISSIRSSQPSIRLAWVRLDRTFNDRRSGFILFGQDWTPFGSSTTPNTIETTGFHLGYGNIYERAPQIRTGLNFLLSKNRNLRFQPEFAIVLPFFGNTPSNAADQLGFGERQGPDSNRPEFQGRFVLQFQLDKAAGVVPAQLIASWTYGARKAIVTRANVPAAFLAAFPSGAEVDSNRWGYTGEFQLPTRWFTLIGKFYRGADLRAYFGGQLFSTFNDTTGLTGIQTATSIDGSSTVAFGFLNGQPVIADQNPVRGYGGFINLGIPLSRVFGADPKGRMAGWTAYLHYGLDAAVASDVRRLLGNTLNPIGQPTTGFGANRARSDVAMGSLQYRLNSFVTFAYELSYFRTRAANNAAPLPLFRGIPSRSTQNIRNEFATIFTF
jgi:hypothetical protein